MENIKLELRNFKCFQEEELCLNNLTVLLGANATGKSSIIQALQLYLKAVNSANSDGVASISLYKDFGYDMGIVENLVKRDAPDDKIIITINNKALTIHLNEHPKLSDVVNAHTTYQKIEHSYLCAERLGPRNTIEYHNSPDCGIHGEYTPYIISKDSEIEADTNKWLGHNLEGTFSAQLDDWIQFIFPNIKVQASCQFNKIAFLQVNSKGNWLIPTHVGFGISYALPILVEGLRLKSGSWYIVENPEAHLQPKAQTQIGYFLGKIAAAGVRVVVETHSEHVLEGMAAVTHEDINGFTEDSISVFILEQESNRPQIKKVPLQRNGVAKEDFPKDFFDYGLEDVKRDVEFCAKKLKNIGDLLR